MQLVNCKDIRENILQEVKQQVKQLDFVPQIHIVTYCIRGIIYFRICLLVFVLSVYF